MDSVLSNVARRLDNEWHTRTHQSHTSLLLNFQVETIGDCYVAAAGLPNPRHDHAVVMCRFARDCLDRMNAVVRRLETVLGPDTSELVLRVGKLGM